ncbi:MAG: cytochrome c biogenesis protein CcsA [Bacteroidetes bacterium]|nr:cytochrome c biogenesis protein CcsA [Bacteroidota bacterium]
MDIHAIGANVIFGKAGHFLIILSFVSALVSAIAYGISSSKNDIRHWEPLGRYAFLLHSVAIFGVIFLMLFMIHSHMFEYAYVWRSSNNELPMRFLLSSFWEGQEGSTMLWMFWLAVIGIILIFRSKEWESPVMIWVALAQALLSSMLLGIIVFGYKMGANPFTMLKDYMDAPVFKLNPGFIPEDGSGLNPLLQNYWMTIHPPTLFLGYALTIVPFAYAMASLMKRSYTDWVRPVLPWALATIMVLGVGILMGGAWAYEALSFGGFWAWDPVENASLVPWLIIVAGLHTLLAYRHSGYSLSATYLLFAGSFLMVLYSSFLTKSGILGDSSVHSFTDMGMSGQLVLMMIVFVVPAIGIYVLRWRDMPRKPTEERLSSREFWLFIGSAVFILSAVHITVITSFPVINKIFNTRLAPPADIERMFNDVQIWIGIILGVLLALGQYLNYRKSNKSLLRHIAIPLVISTAIAIVLILHFELYRIDALLLTFAASFGVVANIYYIFLRLKGKVHLYGGSVSHAGFALMMLGILISQGKQEVVSYNQFGVDYGESYSDQDKADNILLYKDEASTMDNYRITYLGDSVVADKVFYKVKYEPLDASKKSFTLTPHLQLDKEMGNVANPSTRRTLTSDLYTHITGAPISKDGRVPDSTQTNVYTVKLGDTIKLSRSIAILDHINPSAESPGYEMGPEDIAVGAQMRYITVDSTYHVEPLYLIQNRIARSVPVSLTEKNITFVFTKIIPETAEIEISFTQEFPRYIIMKAIIFPYINLLWLGAVVMSIGVVMSMYHRQRQKNKFERTQA